MTKNEKYAINIVIEKMKNLASLDETWGLSQDVKDEIRPYISWFEHDIYFLSRLVDANDKFETKKAIENIEKYCI